MCTGVRFKKCPKCNRNGGRFSPYIKIGQQTTRCADSRVPTPAGSKYPTKCHTVHWTEDPNPATDRCANCKSLAILNPKTEADFVLAKQAEEAEQATKKSKEEARARNKGKAAAYKATAPAKKAAAPAQKDPIPAKRPTAPVKKTPRFIPSQEALDRAKATAGKTPKKTRGAVEKAPKKTTKAAIKADQAMLMSAFTYHQVQAAEASAKSKNAG